MVAGRLDSVRYVRNGDVSIALETRGSGSTHLLFAHGWISSRRMWYDVAARLDLARYTLHMLDFRGAGESDRPQDGHDLEGYASDLRAVIASIDAPLTVVAHSMGGKITQFVALEPPGNMKRLVLVAPGSARAVPLDERHRALAMLAFGSRARIARFQRGAMTRPIPDESFERIITDALIAQREAWFNWYDRGRTADFSARLGEITLPAIVLGADKDPLAPPARLRANVIEPIDGALSVMLRGVGHNIPVEAPDELAALIDRFCIAN
jgi:pimeloyl-ACP methyl ester carboxylesterase